MRWKLNNSTFFFCSSLSFFFIVLNILLNKVKKNKYSAEIPQGALPFRQKLVLSNSGIYVLFSLYILSSKAAKVRSVAAKM